VGFLKNQLNFSDCPNKVFRLVSEIRPSYWCIISLERSVQPDQPTSSDHLVDTETMLQDTLVLCLVGVGVGQIVSFRNQQSFRGPSGIIGFDANGRITIQRPGGTFQRLSANRKRGAQSFSVQSGEPFLPVLSSRAESQDTVDARQQLQQQLNLQEALARQQIQRQEEALARQQEQTRNAQAQVQNIIQEALARQVQSQAEQLIRQQTGPVSITIETDSASLPLTNTIPASTAGLGGILVANEQVSGSPCAARNGIRGDCRLLIKCIRFFFELEVLQSVTCDLGGGLRGICCPHTLLLDPPVVDSVSFKPSCPSNIICRPNAPVVVIPDIRLADITEAANIAIRNIKARQKFATALFKKGVFVKKKTSAAASQRFKQTNRFASQVGIDALTALETSQQLSAAFKLDKDQGRFALPKFSLKGSKISDTCPRATSRCIKNAKYRTLDGSCNNEENVIWGRSNTALQRLLPSEYEDGLETPRTKGLPSARAVSTATISSQSKENKKYTLMLMQWGQFVDHDITHTPVVKGTEESGILCCEDGEIIKKKERNRECMPIDIPENDSVFGKFGQKCMEFVRSMPAPRSGCNFGPREQMNQITAWQDGSNVYGSDPDEGRKLRLLGGGRLRVTRVQGRDLLPLNPAECSDDARHRYCFSAGDLRCNEQLELTVLHTVWMREHNRIADKLAVIRPGSSDETLYQEARRIVIAQMQHITYNEWLPIVLGMKYMQKWSMEPRESGFSDTYSKDVDPAITNAFATAAFRFGHSLIAGVIESYNVFGTKVKSVPLTKSQFAPYDLYDNLTLETFVRGLTTQKSQDLDASFSPELTQHLFQQESEQFGLDLVSLNIQRGRDHGLAPYTAWRKLCGQEPVNSWKELSEMFPDMNVARLQALYTSVDDIDLFIGGILEPPTEGSLLGPTFLCIVGDQFQRIRSGDRFWYEEKENGFTEEQLEEVRKTSLARVLCDNADGIEVIQPLAFHTPDVANRRVACDSEEIPSIDLSLWDTEV